ncbi:hypothetical protein BK764_11080 [Bacillus thuringiensis serovar israelensis]|jgi:hypothetical protein|uniref:Uncharacterized protein n=2 Tax=Bacillus thuringiensis TaxID=1428 RepID=A0A7D3ZV50_BACTU|nr:hypothetical protein ATN07_31600 [Bacillus thuringiensis serovar israelensis]EEM74357.1 hypothetical protein bthur0010_56160 [Bacillus thuringiensis serovar pondicheriensis BGSC 4BA1]EEN00087.1 hypothetical protein bthur0014_55820 [Bacillus thuringiensis IBL 4222]KAA8487287.1 hypothetical protein FYW98_16480 [Bacillus thuringiensis]KRD80598.1 hypothetical protein ASE53_16140 [Bacillus sp. Root11]KRD85129.1 hypothetical protein ASE54_16145 [Bacillus sp. Root131]OTX59652.1 hypothetical prote
MFYKKKGGYNLEKWKQLAKKKETRRLCLPIMFATVFMLTVKGFAYRNIYLNSLPKDIFNIPLPETGLFFFISYGEILALATGVSIALCVLNIGGKRFGRPDLEIKNDKLVFKVTGIVVLLSPIITCINIAVDYKLDVISYVLLVVTTIVYAVLSKVSRVKQ